jgi:hypothetical protein
MQPQKNPSNRKGQNMSTATDYFEKYLKMPKAELALKMVESPSQSDLLASVARVAYEVILQDEKSGYDKEQMRQRHELDLKLLQEQAKIIKSSNRLIAISTISAALLGAIVGSVLQYKLTQKPVVAIQQSNQISEPSTSTVQPEKTIGKVPSSPLK